MSEPEVAKAARRINAPATFETGIVLPDVTLNLVLTDPDCVQELSKRAAGFERDEYARTCLRIGVLALRQAGGTVDAQVLRNEGEKLVEALKGKLDGHATSLEAALATNLKLYFDPISGHFSDRVKALTSTGGDLARLLTGYVGDSGVLATQLAHAVGKDSELMKHLSPTQKNGLIETIASITQERLEEQSKKVLDEFNLNDERSALSRLVKNVTEISKQIGEKFDPEDDKSVVWRLNKALEATQKQIRADLTLDDKDSSLAKLQASLKQQVDEIVAKQTAFHDKLSTKLGLDLGVANTPRGGVDFESVAGKALGDRIRALGDGFATVGKLKGSASNLKGDHEQVLGAESAAPGAKIVYECKQDESFRHVAKALEELSHARPNRQAEIGVFIMSAATLRDLRDKAVAEGKKPDIDYPAALERRDNDIIVVWDAANPATDVVLDCAIGLARALIVRAKRTAAVTEEEVKGFNELDEAVIDLEKQFDRFNSMSKWCDDITESSKNITKIAADVKEELRLVLKRLNGDVKSLKKGVASLRAGDLNGNGGPAR